MTKRLIVSLLFIAAVANAQWVTSATNIPNSSNLSGALDAKPNYQLSGTSGCAALSGTVGKDICTDSAGKFYVPSVTGTPATWVQIPAGTATALVATPSLCSSGSAPTGVLANGNATGCASISGGGGGACAASLGQTTAISQTGSPVTIFSVAGVPALAAGTCYRITYATTLVTDGSTEQLWVDSTAVATVQVWGGSLGWAASDFMFCNAPGSQTTQTISFVSSGYAGSNVSGAYNSFISVPPIPTVTSVNMATTHTFKITGNAPGGTTQGQAFRIGQ